MILRISFKILKTHRRGLYLKQLLIYYNPINLIESKIGETTIDIFFPAKERKPSLSVWIRLQFPHSRVFNLTNVICISSVMIATLPRTPCDYCFFFIKIQLNTQFPPPFLQHTSHVVMVISCILHGVHLSLLWFHQSGRDSQQYDRKDSKISHSVPSTLPFLEYPFPHLNRITISHCYMQFMITKEG